MRTVRVLSIAVALLLGRPAAADMLPDGKAGVGSDFSVTNLGEFPERVFVVYPALCDWRTHKPSGVAAGDDAEEGGYPDYLVIGEGVQAVSGRCQESVIYALERAAWTLLPRPPRPEGWPEDEVMWIPIKELQAMSARERASFFAGDPRASSTGKQLQPTRWVVDDTERVRHVHDVLAIRREGERFALQCVRVHYAYSDDTEEVVACTADERPQPTGMGMAKRGPPRDTLSLLSSVPRWPFIAGAGLVFAIMALLGLRRRRG